jgi:hypothetical protein
VAAGIEVDPRAALAPHHARMLAALRTRTLVLLPPEGAVPPLHPCAAALSAAVVRETQRPACVCGAVAAAGSVIVVRPDRVVFSVTTIRELPAALSALHRLLEMND